jgi:RNA polymerase sigma-70 factor (ECF subfamily)
VNHPAGYSQVGFHLWILPAALGMGRDSKNWVEELSAREESALIALRDALLRNLRKALANRPRADDSFLDDMVQEALLRILDRLNRFEGRSHFLTWATSIAIRTSLGHLRRSHWKDVSLSDLDVELDTLSAYATDSNLTPDARTQRHAMISALLDAIKRELTDRQRTALLAELKGMPLAEIARHLSTNRNSVYKLTHDARKKLKKRLEAVGYTAEDVVTTCAY